MTAAKHITQAELKKLLAYDPITGEWTWLSSGKGRRPDSRAGTMCGGYANIRINRRGYAAHRLAWLYMTGEWPTLDVDHENRIKTDNRWGNLRLATRAQNNANALKRSRNKSGFKGVTAFRQKWCAWIRADYKSIYLGLYDSPEEAHEAYLSAARERWGAFARGS